MEVEVRGASNTEVPLPEQTVDGTGSDGELELGIAMLVEALRQEQVELVSVTGRIDR